MSDDILPVFAIWPNLLNSHEDYEIRIPKTPRNLRGLRGLRERMNRRSSDQLEIRCPNCE
jgi:hypothetical protein